MTDVREEALVLERVPYIYYLVQFKKDAHGTQVQALIDSDSEVNAITPAYALKLGLQVHHTNIKAQKIDGSTLKTFGMVLASFQMEDKLGRIWFFQEMFLLADITAEVVLNMPFLTFSNVDVQFVEK